jgi:hypothetical protein
MTEDDYILPNNYEVGIVDVKSPDSSNAGLRPPINFYSRSDFSEGIMDQFHALGGAKGKVLYDESLRSLSNISPERYQ